MQTNTIVSVLVRTLALGAMCAFASWQTAKTQQPASAPANAPASNPATDKAKSKHADDFLIHGTVFTPEGLSFPAAELRIRKTTEKKFRWKTETNSRGEFAVRVKQGSQYVVLVHVKGFTEQSKTVDGTVGKLSDDLVFRMEPREGKKP